MADLLSILKSHPFTFSGEVLEVEIRECEFCAGHPELVIRSRYHRDKHAGQDAEPIEMESVGEALQGAHAVALQFSIQAEDEAGERDAVALFDYITAWGTTCLEIQAALERSAGRLN